MRFKKAPLRSAGGEPITSSVCSERDTPENTIITMTDSADHDQKPNPRLLMAQFVRLGESASKGVTLSPPAPPRTYRGGRSSSYSSSSTSKDEETQAAQAKLRQYEALGLIKVEVDEPSSDDGTNTQILKPDTRFTGGVEVPMSQRSDTFQHAGPGNVVFYTIPHQPPTVVAQQQAQPMPVSQQVGVVDVPALTDMEGDYGFSVATEEKERTTKSPMWLMSKITNKLYANINKAVPFEIRMKKRVPREQFRVRAVAVFSSAQFLRTNVTRCPNHASPADVTNHDFPFPEHVVRADHPGAQYETSPNGRLSVVVPLDVLQDGSSYTPILLRFMCLGSCVGGINRRPIAIIMTLENCLGQVFGQKVIDVRVCACPTRDIKTDEQGHRGLKRKGSSHQLQEKSPTVIRKKPKIVETKQEPQDDDRIFTIHVRGQKLYDFTMKMIEAYYQTHPEYARKYPDDFLSLETDEDSEDDLKGKNLQIDVGDTETVNWDSGGESPQRIVINHNPQTGTYVAKDNSPLSKLKPSISISPPHSIQLRLWQEESEEVNIPQGVNQCDYPLNNIAQSSDMVINNSPSSCTLKSNSSTKSKTPSVQNQPVENITCVSKHIPVMPVPSKPGGTAVKTKPMPLLKHYVSAQNGGNRGNRSSSKKKIAKEDVTHSLVEPIETSFSMGLGPEHSSPGSPEMLAANVLVEGFKDKSLSMQ